MANISASARLRHHYFYNKGNGMSAGNDVAAEVLAVEQAWTEAHRRGDVAAIARLMTDDYVKIQPNGAVVDKAASLAAYLPEERQWELAEGDEYDIRVYGDVAVVIGRWRARGVNHGVRFDYAARFLSVYVRRAGGWQMAAEQSTEIREPA
jgi:ketosteroid isomerase-like protein